MNPLSTGLVLLACAAFVYCIGLLARIKREQIAKWEQAHKAFYRHTAHLVENAQTPEEVLGFLDFMSGMIGRKSAVLLFTCLALLDREGRDAPESVTERKIRGMPQPLRQSFSAAVDAGFRSLGWRSLILGWAFRLATKPVRTPRNGGDSSAAEIHLVEKACARAAA